MAFAERVTIYIETKVDNAKSSLSGFKQSVAQAEGVTGKLKATASGLGSAVSGAVSALASPAGLASVATAVVGFAAKSVGAFQELGTSVGKFSDATGTTAEDASRLVEVFGDLGIAPDTAAASIGKMSKTLATNADALAEYGITVKKAADGTTDVTATFLAAVDTISKIRDPTQQAAAAQATFGKSWQSMAEVIQGGAPALKAAMDSVQSSKVLSSADVQSARDLRAGLDALKDAGEGLALSMGKALAPAVASIATKLGDLVSKAEPAFAAMGKGLADTLEGLGPVIDGIGLLADGVGKLQAIDIKAPSGATFTPFAGGITQAYQAWDNLKNAFGDAPKLKAGFEPVAEGIDLVTKSQNDAKEATDKAVAALEGWAKSNIVSVLKEQADAIKADVDALNSVSDAYASAADDQISYNKALDEFKTKAKDSKASADDVRDSAIGASKAHADLYTSMTESAGAAATATGKLDAQNQTLLDTAATARGPARQGILDYIGALNGIPPEKMTEIKAALARGDVEEAKRLLDEASANRTATLKADADNGALAQTNRDLDNAAHDRTVQFNAQAVGLGALTGAFAGAIRAAGGTVQSAGVSAATRSGAAPVTYTTNVTNNVIVPRIPSGRELARVSERWSRVDGRR